MNLWVDDWNTTPCNILPKVEYTIHILKIIMNWTVSLPSTTQCKLIWGFYCNQYLFLYVINHWWRQTIFILWYFLIIILQQWLLSASSHISKSSFLLNLHHPLKCAIIYPSKCVNVECLCVSVHTYVCMYVYNLTLLSPEIICLLSPTLWPLHTR